MDTRILLALLAIAAVFLLGCTRTTAQPNVIIEFQRSGGIMGLDETLTITSGNKAVLKRRNDQKEFVVRPEAVKQAIDQLDAANFTKLNGNYPAPRGSADLIQYTIKYKGYQVTGSETVIPDPLQLAIATLNDIVEQNNTP